MKSFFRAKLSPRCLRSGARTSRSTASGAQAVSDGHDVAAFKETHKLYQEDCAQIRCPGVSASRGKSSAARTANGTGSPKSRPAISLRTGKAVRMRLPTRMGECMYVIKRPVRTGTAECMRSALGWPAGCSKWAELFYQPEWRLYSHGTTKH